MQLSDLQNKSIAILGFGQEGQAVLSYLNSHGLQATVLDKAKDGDDYLATLKNFEIIFRSPGIWRQTPEILEAEKAGSVITSQAKWFFESCPAKIIGVTGTKGKGTTCALIHEILQKSFPEKQIYLTGNIGKTQPLEFLDKLTSEDLIVYEMSSFQLQDLNQSPQIGVCLMVTSDHLNHHANLDEYHNAKAAIVAFQNSHDIAIYNEDFEASRVIGQQGSGVKQTISSKHQPDSGVFIDGANNRIEISLDGEKITINCADRKLRGVHNLQNIAAASLVALNLKVSKEIIEQVIQEFAGLEHRLQLVGDFGGVKYYNDSISTVPETTIAALNSFTEPVHLFLGGDNKNIDYSGLVADLKARTNLVSIILLGQVGAILKPELEKSNLSSKVYGPFTDFKEAVNEAKQQAKAGDVVLLSPGASSFDMFENYAQRGHQFAELVSRQS